MLCLEQSFILKGYWGTMSARYQARRHLVLIYSEAGEMQHKGSGTGCKGPHVSSRVHPAPSPRGVMATRLGQIPERLLGQLWKERAARQGVFRSKSGRRYRVIYPGRSNSGAGPDFRGAVLEEEGVGLLTGDVELHLDEKDWRSHGHGTDPRYNGVVLHAVVEGENGTTTLQNGNQVPVITLEGMLNGGRRESSPSRLWELLSVHGYACPDTPGELAETLRRAGDAWFDGAASGFRILLDAGEEPEETMYSGIMEALGYSQNRQGFLDLARMVPYKRLKTSVVKGEGDDGASPIAHALLKAAGLQDAGPPKAGDAVLGGRRAHLKWNTFRVRPSNHPRNRILGGARLLERYLSADAGAASGEGPCVDEIPAMGRGKGLLGGLREVLEAAPDDGRGCRVLLDGLMVAPLQRRGPARRGAIGNGRAADIAVNVVLPFYDSLAEREGLESLADKCAGLYRRFPRLQPNEITTEMEEQLGRHLSRNEADSGSALPGTKVRSLATGAREQQGLLHLHHLITSPPVARR